MNSKQLLFQISVMFVVSFNTVGAIQQVQAKLVTHNQGSMTTTNGDLIPLIISLDSNGNKTPHALGILSSTHSVGSYSVLIQPELGGGLDSRPIRRITGAGLPTIPTATPIAPVAVPASSLSVFQGPDAVVVPVLLYHWIDVSLTDSQYYVSPDKFEEQMKLLRDWGYTTITTELLVKSITEGADLPQHPLLITFDDGHLNNYTTAFPIMQKYGFTGVLYIIGEYMGTPGYMNADQIKEMARAGWEVGSHSMSHPDLTSLDPQQQRYEIVESRRLLETELGVPILTFAYPFGEDNMTVVNMVYSSGYIAGMGLGYTHDQRLSNLFALQRRGVNGTSDINAFAAILPWQGDLVYLPAVTPIPDSASISSP